MENLSEIKMNTVHCFPPCLHLGNERDDLAGNSQVPSVT